MSIFNLSDQNANLDNKIVAGLERLSQVFRILLWGKAKLYSLSPIQIQILIFIQHHSSEKTTVSYLAREFNLTKPTISDAIKILEQKQLVKKITDTYDTRSYTLKLTAAGKKIAIETESFANPITQLVSNINDSDKTILWEHISNLISVLNKQEILSIQRTCFNCKYYEIKANNHFCNLINNTLATNDLRLDCGEFEPR